MTRKRSSLGGELSDNHRYDKGEQSIIDKPRWDLFDDIRKLSSLDRETAVRSRRGEVLTLKSGRGDERNRSLCLPSVSVPMKRNKTDESRA